MQQQQLEFGCDTGRDAALPVTAATRDRVVESMADILTAVASGIAGARATAVDEAGEGEASDE